MHAMKNVFVYGLLMTLLAGASFAEPVNHMRAKDAASGWKGEGRQILNHKMDKPVKKITTYSEFHVIELEPEGFIVVPADDTIEPIIAFSEKGVLAPDDNNPLWRLLNKDMSKRGDNSRSKRQKFAGFNQNNQVQGKPDKLLETMQKKQNRFTQLEHKGKAKAEKDVSAVQINQQSFAVAPEDHSSVYDPFADMSTSRIPVAILSALPVDGKMQITHDSDESVTISVSFDGGASWQVLDSGIVWPVWTSKQQASELMGWFKAEKDGIYDAMAVDAMRHPAPPMSELADDMMATNEPVTYAQSFSISDLRVAPLIRSKWGQTAAGGYNCYNYYTPNNYPDGCVATAMAQLMRYWRYPSAGIGQITRTVKVNGANQTKTTLGGNGTGGAYNWDSMPFTPSTSAYNLSQWQMIGSLCFDAGVCVSMMYSSSGSGAYMSYARDALANNFMYSNAIYRYINGGASSGLWDLILRSNLAGGYPVLLGIDNATSGHAVVCDGFGYSSGTLYYHINMGWGGTDDAWYNLPTVDDGYYNFTSVDEFIYNVFTAGSGELLAGRVMSAVGAPLSAVSITATCAGTSYTTTTDAKGYYAVKVPSLQMYSVTATKAGYNSASLSGITIASSSNGGNGNYFGADMTLSSFSFTATPLTNSVVLRWSSPTNAGMTSSTVYIRHRTDRYPTNSSDGTEIYTGTNLVYEHTGLSSSGMITNYYMIWGNSGSSYVDLTDNNTASGVPDPGALRLFWQSSAGTVSSWLLSTNGTKKSGGDVYPSVIPPTSSVISGVGDIDRDGTADLIWHTSTGEVRFWILNPDGTKKTGGTVYPSKLLPSDWVIRGVGDIDRDGTIDLIWQSQTGDIRYWLLNPDGTKRTGGTVYPSIIPPTNWVIRGVGDIDRDGTVDLIWHTSTGEVRFWILNPDGTKKTGGTVYPSKLLPSDWVIRGVGDIDRDGTVDIIWQSAAGDIRYWMLNPDGTKKTGGVVYPTIIPPTSSVISGVGDINRDGTVDIIWQYATGDIRFWILNPDGSKKTGGSVYSGLLSPTSWIIRGVGDL